MVWEILAVWAIVGSVVVWFLRDERQRRDRKLSARARRFAETPFRRQSNRRSLEEETLAGAHAAQAVASVTPPAPPAPKPQPAPVLRSALAPHDLEFIAQLRGEALEQA